MSQVATSPLRASSFNAWFLWKETRQLLPLVVSLFIVAAFLIVAQLFLGRRMGFELLPFEIVFLIFPGLFATGAGAVMVGQEREQGTIDWLASLPITPSRLVLTKVAIAGVGLVVMWILAFVCMEMFSSLHPTQASWRTSSIRSPSDGIRYPMLIAHSVVVLLSGFYASWRIKEQFQALCALAALACLPLVLSEIVTAVVNPGNRAIQSQSLWLMSSLVLIPVIGLIGYRTAVRSLLPQAAPKIRFAASTQVQPASLAPQAPTFGSHLGPIVWQAVHATPILLAALTFVLIAGVVVPPLLAVFDESRQLFQDSPLFLLLLLSPIAVSWLGVSVFKNDASSQRIRFLADRGVNPTMIYLGRHAVPLALIATASLIYAVIATMVVINHRSAETELLPSLTALLLFFGVVYSISQWVSQLVRTLTLSVILAPVVSVVALAWLFSAAVEFGTPIWIVVICMLLPMMATWLMMNRYVDASDRIRSSLLAIIVVLLVMLLPLISVVLGLAEYERMPAAKRTALLKEGRAILNQPDNSVKLRTMYWQTEDGRLTEQPYDEDKKAQWSADWIGKDSTSPARFLSSLDKLRKDPTLAADVEGYFHTGFLHEFMLRRLKFEESTEEGRDAEFDAYASWLSAAAIVVRALRNSRQQLNQERADLLELSLIDALQAPAMDAYRSGDEVREIATMLPSTQQRNARRRAAILADWAQVTRTRNWTDKLNQRAGLYYAVSRQPPVVMQFGGLDRHQEEFVMVALDALDVTASGNASWQRRMHDLVVMPAVPFELGPYSPRFRDQPAIKIFRTDLIYPGRYWGMQWEADIQKLKDSFQTVESKNLEATE